jgi:hypothetical protein
MAGSTKIVGGGKSSRIGKSAGKKSGMKKACK